MTDEEILSGYLNYVREAHESNGPMKCESYLAWEEVTSLVERDPERAWAVLLRAIAGCPHDTEYLIGAGPLEDLLVRHPRAFAQRVATELRINRRFVAAFVVVNFSTEYVSLEDAGYFNETLRAAGVSQDLISDWRIDDGDQSV